MWVFSRSQRSNSTVVRGCPRSGHLTIKEYVSWYFMTKPDAISDSDSDDFYYCESWLIFTKFCKQSEYMLSLKILDC